MCNCSLSTVQGDRGNRAVHTGDGEHGGHGDHGDGTRSGVSRRRILAAGGIAAVGGLSTFAARPALGATPSQTPGPKGEPQSRHRTSVITVGTSGGPIWWEGSERRGICTVVEVAGRRYMVDSGHGSAAGLRPAGLVGPLSGRNDLTAFKAVFLTHLHSDHVTDLSNLLVQGWVGSGVGGPDWALKVYGPGPRGSLPNVFPPTAPVPSPFLPENPTPGTRETVDLLLRAFATDINDRMFDASSPPITQRIEALDITLPEGTPPHSDSGGPPSVRPFTVFEDDVVKVSATLVDHGQMVPSFGYRFDSDDGAVVISGDTTVSDNLVQLAAGADILLHEVIDEAWVVASIDSLTVPEPVKESFRNHMLGAHTTIPQLAEIVKDAQVGSVVLHHLVPGELPRGGWAANAATLQTQVRAKIVLGQDGGRLGVGRRR